jgi:hypothetical protein
VRPFPYSEELPVPKTLENLTFSDDNSDSDEDHEHQGGGSVEYGPTFEASCSSSQLNLLTKGDLNDIPHDLNLCKKEAAFFGSRLKGRNFLHQDSAVCLLYNRQIEFREFFSQENDLVIGNYVSSVTEDLGHQHIHLSGVCFVTLQKLA